MGTRQQRLINTSTEHGMNALFAIRGTSGAFLANAKLVVQLVMHKPQTLQGECGCPPAAYKYVRTVPYLQIPAVRFRNFLLDITVYVR
jgi:hypothetical protein